MQSPRAAMRTPAALLRARWVPVAPQGSAELRLLALAQDASCAVPLASLVSCSFCLSLCAALQNQVILLAHPPLITPLFSCCRQAEDSAISFHWCSALRATASAARPNPEFSPPLPALIARKLEADPRATCFPCVTVVKTRLILFKGLQRILMMC